MNLLNASLFFLLGLIFGSFFNVVGLRLPKNKLLAVKRSFCPHCGNVLTWKELVPILSFIIQCGSCRYCQGRIAYMYPLIELLTGCLFLFSYIQIGEHPELIVAIALCSLLIIILVTDLTFMLIPNKLLLFFLPIFILLRIVYPSESFFSHFIGGVTGILLLAIIILLSNGGMGGGDMKLFGVIGYVVGLKKLLLTLFLSCVIGAGVGMFLLLFRVVGRKQPIPFAPYIVIATIITYFNGDELINWYTHNFI